MAPRWFEDRDESMLQKLALAPLDAAALAYRGVTTLHRRVGRRGWREPTRLSCKVVSVGNLTVGGSGKTPLAAWLAASLRSRGHRVVLASRGYGRRGSAAVEVVSDGTHVRSTAEQAGDEPMLLAAHAPGVPVLVGADRGVVGLRAVSAFGAQVLVLDDGFQHHRLARDLDLVAVDGGAGFGNRRMLPRGPLREPLTALARADAIVVVDPPLRDADQAAITRHAVGARHFLAARRPRAVRPLAGGAAEKPEWLQGREVGLLSGLARPDGFHRTVAGLGARIVAERSFRDHHRYRPKDLRRLADQAPLWITTEKDAVKILPEWAAGADLRVLRIGIEVVDANGLLEWLEGRLRTRARGRDVTLPGGG